MSLAPIDTPPPPCHPSSMSLLMMVVDLVVIAIEGCSDGSVEGDGGGG